MNEDDPRFRDEDELLAQEQRDELSLQKTLMTPLDAEEGGSWYDEDTSPFEDPDRVAR